MSPTRSQSSRQIKPVSYAAVRDRIRNGDIALCRGGSVQGMLISEVTGSQYTHATMLGWAKPNTLMIGETRQRADGRLIDCRSEIARWPGYYDVYRVCLRPFDGNAAWTFVCHAAGSKYGWAHIARIWARRRLGERLVPAIPNSDDPASERFCSELVHAALRTAGGPECKEFDCDVAPGDLACSPHLRYLFTLFACEAQVEEARLQIANCKL